MAVFRIERTRDYTVMSNHHLRDKALSLKSKGLLSMMLSLPEDWNYTTRGLAKICKEGVDAIGGALRELESAGYIVRHQLRDRQGRISDTEYVIYEQPQPKAPDTPQPDTASPDTENPYLAGPDTEKPAELNIEKSKTQKQTTDVPSTDSIPFREKAAARPPERKGRDAMSVEEMQEYRDLVLENIEYDHLCREFTTYREDLDEIVELIVETVCARRKSTRIAGADFPHEVVRSRFLKLDSSHIEFVMECLHNNTTEIRNIKQYLELPDAQASALLASPSPVADVYKEFTKRETGQLTMLQDIIEEQAVTALGAQRELPLYRHDAAYAREQGDLDLYRASRRANIACKEAIEASISEHYRDNRLDRDAVPQVIEQFGYTRTLYVLANTVQQMEWDGRFSPANKAWAKTVDIPPTPDGFGSDRNLDFVVDSHPGLVDLFLSQARQDYLRLQPLTPEEIHAEAARLLQELRAPDTPNSPHGTHYMARVSPDFLARAGTQAHDQLMALLPFRSLAITGMKDLPGTYVTILASEDRSKELRQRRPSVRRQLKQEPRSAEKKAPVRKKKEPER